MRKSGVQGFGWSRVDRSPRVNGVSALGLALAFAALAPASPACAQQSGRWVLSGGLAISVPQSEFADFVDDGFGIGTQLLYRADPAGVLSLRLDAAIVTYGRERLEAPLSRTVSRINVDVVTRNNILLAGLGPQLTLPAGRFRPYVNGAIGLGYFFTESEVKGTGNFLSDGFARTTNFDDVSFSYGGGGGLELGLHGGPHPLLLNMDFQYRNHGKTRFLRKGSIQEDGTGRVSFAPLEAEADLLLIRVGLSFGL
ncbi:MAG: outer membrane beta-barrel protein [Gemmatimonadota bacterium]